MTEPRKRMELAECALTSNNCRPATPASKSLFALSLHPLSSTLANARLYLFQLAASHRQLYRVRDNSKAKDMALF